MNKSFRIANKIMSILILLVMLSILIFGLYVMVDSEPYQEDSVIKYGYIINSKVSGYDTILIISVDGKQIELKNSDIYKKYRDEFYHLNEPENFRPKVAFVYKVLKYRFRDDVTVQSDIYYEGG